MKYQVNLITESYTTGIDTIKAKKGYTAKQYIADCEKNADEEWCEMIHSGDIELVEIEEEKANYDDLETFAKLECIREYVGRVDPYNGELDTMPLADIEEGIRYFLEADDNFTIDEQGRWYFEGMRV